MLALLICSAIQAAGWWKPVVAASDTPDLPAYLLLLARIFLAAWLLVAVQLWIALRFASFVTALALGIGGTLFAVVATSAKNRGLPAVADPGQPAASDPSRAQLTLLLGFAGGCVALVAMT